jgi:hypothetical protein
VKTVKAFSKAFSIGIFHTKKTMALTFENFHQGLKSQKKKYKDFGTDF